jgi:single-strand DNA-binding protein
MGAYAQIYGHLGQDVELRHTNSGVPVVNLSVASNRSRRDGNGEKIQIADWFHVSVFGRDAEILVQFAHKGSALSFNGRLQTDAYHDREGVERIATFLIADSFEFLPGHRRNGEGEREEAMRE